MGNLFNYLVLPVNLFGITAIAAMGLQLILGGAGLLTLGHTAFFAIGGYSSAYFVMFTGPYLNIHNPGLLLLLGILSSLVFSFLASALVAIPCLRLRGDYLAVATMGLGQIVENVFNNLPQFGGASGLTNIPQLCGPLLIWILVLSVGLFLRSFYQTHIGHAVLCSRDDEVVARCFEISPERSKLIAFIVGNMITGLAGALYVHSFQFISPVSAGFQKSVEILLAVVIGGMYSLWGSVLGAAVLVLVPELLRFIPSDLGGFFGPVFTRFAQNSTLLFSLIVLAILKINAQGIMAILINARKSKDKGKGENKNEFTKSAT
jgi:branched-chain amino acid transport system permease protein